MSPILLHTNTFQISVVNTMRAALAEGVFFTNQELLELLSTYRKVVWRNGNMSDKIAYYSILCNYAGSSGKDGEMLYYAEKIKNLEETESGLSICYCPICYFRLL
ncbi:MAG: hypothetical protein KL787_06245 [Taibaiella sp.]|nr:hypothetical protein [Taibaiella sp.]